MEAVRFSYYGHGKTSCDNAKHKGAKHEHREDLTPEQQERIKGCSDSDELLKLAMEEGYELSDEQMEAVTGGGWHEPCTTLEADDVQQSGLG